MSKKYKGFKGSGMKPKKAAHYEVERIVNECLFKHLAKTFSKKGRLISK